MHGYLIFVLVTAITVMSPGPGVLLTLTNAIRHGLPAAIFGFLGLALGIFIVASISATSLGILLATSSVAFSVLKYVGAVYLIYLGVKLWRSPAKRLEVKKGKNQHPGKLFMEGLALQVTNPKAIFFFMSVFPQFIDYSTSYVHQFMVMVATYSALVIFIHLIYAYLARQARDWFSSERGGLIVNRLGGGTFVCFGLGLASATK